MRYVYSDGYTFGFKNAISAFKFDCVDKSDAHFHGAPMKAVDIVVEYADKYFFIEVKEFFDVDYYDFKKAENQEEEKRKRKQISWLKNSLKYKFRDSLLFRYAEDKLDKPVHYLCILNLEPSMLFYLTKFLSKELPVGRPCRRWKRSLAAGCFVLNKYMFEKMFMDWSVQKDDALQE